MENKKCKQRHVVNSYHHLHLACFENAKNKLRHSTGFLKTVRLSFFFLVQIKFFLVFFPKLGWKCLLFSEVDYPTITPTYTHIQWLARRCERVKVVSIGTSLSSSSSHSTYCHFSFVQLSATPGIPSRRDCLKLCTVIPTCTIHCIKLQSNAKDTEYLKSYWKDSDAARKW